MKYNVDKVYEAMQDHSYSEEERWELVEIILLHQRSLEKCKVDMFKIPMWANQLLQCPVLQKVFKEELSHG